MATLEDILQTAKDGVAMEQPPATALTGTVYKHAVLLANGVRIDILSMLSHDAFWTVARAQGYIASPGIYLSMAHVAGIFDQTAAPKQGDSNVVPLR